MQMFHVEQPARYLRLWMRDSWIGVPFGAAVAFIRQAR